MAQRVAIEARRRGVPLRLVFAHHAFSAEFDEKRTVSFSGVITKIDWINPHAYFYLDSKDSAGRRVTWTIESFPPAVDECIRPFANEVEEIVVGARRTHLPIERLVVEAKDAPGGGIIGQPVRRRFHDAMAGTRNLEANIVEGPKAGR